MPVCRGVSTVVNIPSEKQSVVLAVRRDDLMKLARLCHRRAHDVLILHAAPVVGKARDVRGHILHIAQRPPLLRHRDRPVRDHADAGIAVNRVKLAFQMFAAVRRGRQVRHRAHRRAAAVRRRARPRPDRFLIRKTRLAKVHMHIRKTGKNNRSVVSVNIVGIGKKIDAGDHAALDRQIAMTEHAVHIRHAIVDSAHVCSPLFPSMGTKKSCPMRTRRVTQKHSGRNENPRFFYAIFPASLYQGLKISLYGSYYSRCLIQMSMLLHRKFESNFHR